MNFGGSAYFYRHFDQELFKIEFWTTKASETLKVLQILTNFLIASLQYVSGWASYASIALLIFMDNMLEKQIHVRANAHSSAVRVSVILK